MVAASTFVKTQFSCEPRSMVVGTPAKVIRKLSEKEFNWKKFGTQEYINLAARCKDSLRIIEPLTEVQANRPRFELFEHNIK